MPSSLQITVDKAYFYALLRRAGFHARTPEGSPSDVTSNVFVPRNEYDALLQLSREYEALKKALYQGGVTPNTIDTLVSSAREPNQRKDSAVFVQPSKAACQDSTCSQSQAYCSTPQHQHDRSWSFSDRSQLHTSDLQRKRTYGVTGKPTSLLNDSDDLDLDGCLVDSSPRLLARGLTAAETPYDNAPRTIYFCGLPDLTSYSELLSVVKGGKLVSLNMPSERSATVSFLDPEAASKYLAWAKRNDVYIRNKRVEVRWAERQFTINSHIVNKIQNGATRNLIISDAQDKGLSERQIRDDMDHIHGLAITGVSFRQGDAHVSMNSIHNALFARTCMLSRTAYKGCKVQFVPDECDVPLPERMRPTKVPAVSVSMEKRRQGAVSNRFDLLNTEGTESGSDVGSDQTSEVDSVGCSS